MYIEKYYSKFISITHERDLVEENKISNRIMSILEHRKEIE